MSARCAILSVLLSLSFLLTPGASVHARARGIRPTSPVDDGRDSCEESATYWRIDSLAFASSPAIFHLRQSCGGPRFVHNEDHWYRSPAPASAVAKETSDSIPFELGALGPPGLEIEKARQAVAAILEQGNSCSAWLRRRDPDPAATFRRIHFRIDEIGPKYATHVRDKSGTGFYQDPYAAMVVQNANPPVWITLNSGGAFFKSATAMRTFFNDGTPSGVISVKRLRIEIYSGDSLAAQIIILLHELAHVLDAIPADGESAPKQLSAQNTLEVLHFCRNQVESSSKRK